MPSFFDTVPKADLEDYPFSLFENSNDKDIPSFLNYLENIRGIDRTTFKEIAWQVAALNSEFLGYQMLAKMTVDMRDHRLKQEAQNQTIPERIKNLSLDDLVASRDTLEGQQEMLKAQKQMVQDAIDNMVKPSVERVS